MKKNLNKKQTNLLIVLGAIMLTAAAIVIFFSLTKKPNTAYKNSMKMKYNSYSLPDYVDVQLIEIDGHARRGVKLDSAVKDIVIHYVANPMSTAQNNRDYFNNEGVNVSSHFVVGLDGEVILCVPLDEKSSASNDRNSDTISIEVCHEDESGVFNSKTYSALVKLTAWLCMASDIDTNHIIRHYDITGKLCPLYYVEHEDKWNEFKLDVESCLKSTYNLG